MSSRAPGDSAKTATNSRAPTSSDLDGELDHDDHNVELDKTKSCSNNNMKLTVDIERLMNQLSIASAIT